MLFKHYADKHGEIEKIRDRLAAINRKVKERSKSRETSPPPGSHDNRLLNTSKQKSLHEIREKLQLISNCLQRRVEQGPSDRTGSSDLDVAKPSPSPRRESSEMLGAGLDLGTCHIVYARKVKGKYIFTKGERNVFLSVQPDKLTQDLLARLNIKCVTVKNKTYVVGDSAFELANILERKTRRTIKRGILNPEETESVPIIKVLIEHVLGEARAEAEPCCFSIPAAPIDGEHDTIHHQSIFEGILKELGFAPFHIDQGYAVILSELAHTHFTGIGVSCGGGIVNVCAAFKSVSMAAFSISRGGDWVDEKVASVLGISASKAAALKEQGVSLDHPAGREEEAIAIYYRHLIRSVCENMAKVFNSGPAAPRFEKPVDIIFSGGSAMAIGFMEVVREELASTDLGFAVNNIERANEPLTSVSRGCLVGATGSCQRK